MTDRLIRQAVIALATVAVSMVLFDGPSILRVPAVLGFALMAPGLAISRFVPTLVGVDRMAFAGAISLACNVLASLLLVALGRWRGAPVLVLLAAISLVLAVAPLQTPWRRRAEQRERLRNEEIRERRRAQALAYEQVQSSEASTRRDGLITLSWMLEADERYDEASELRALARMSSPPRLLLGDQVSSDADVQLIHQRVRSEDPEVRRRGLYEVADLLNETGQSDEADTLRDLASRGEM